MTRIALIAATLPELNRKPGGVEIFVHRLANQLASQPEHQVTVFSLCDRTSNALSDKLYQHQQIFSGFGKLTERKLFVWFVFPLLLNRLNLQDFDIVHLHGDDWFYILRSLPSVRTMHGSALNEARTATSLKRKLMQRLIYPLEHLSANLATITVGVGQDAQEIYNLPYVINNGVDLTQFSPGQKSEQPSILYLGTWEGRKRGQFMYEQFTQHILPRVPDAQLWLVCDRSIEHPNVINYTFPDDQTLAQLYRSAWVFGYPSVYEGFGMAYVEAMASGTAIVTSSNYGAKHVLQEGTYGVIASDPEFSQQIVRLLTQPEQRQALEQKGLARAREFDWSRIAQAYIDIYEKAIAQFEFTERRAS